MALDAERITRLEEKHEAVSKQVAEMKRIIYGAIATIVGAVFMALVSSVLKGGP